MSGIESGWYKDPADPTTQRYWDGEGWLGDPLPIDAAPPPGPPPEKPTQPPPAPTSQPGEAVSPAAAPTPMPGAGLPPPPAPVLPPPHGLPPAEGVPPAQGQPPGTPWQPGTPPPPGWAYPFPYPLAMPAPRPHGLPLAHSGARLVARLIDIVAVLALNVLINGWFVYEYVKEVSPVVEEVWRRSLAGDRSTTGLAFTERATNLQIVIVLLAAALWFAYEVPAVANTGQTLGKRLLGIRVMRLEDGQRLGFRRSFRRWNTMGLPTLLWSCCGLGFILQFVDALFVTLDRPLHQALHDKSALTVVVHVGRSRTASDPSAPPVDNPDNPPGGIR